MNVPMSECVITATMQELLETTTLALCPRIDRFERKLARGTGDETHA